MIQISNLHHSYGSRKVLNGVSLSIQAGEIFGLLGPNGSGKTTLLRILSTAFPLNEGEVKIAGFDLRTQSSEIRKIFGVVFQSPSLDGKLTVLENVHHHGRLYGLTGNALKKRSEEMLTQLGVMDRANERTEKLSGGLKRRVEIAKSLLHSPKLLILDEPSTGLDPGSRHDVWTYLKTLQKSQKTTVLVTTHLMEEAELCDRLAILHQGNLAGAGKPDELKKMVGGDVIQIQSADAEKLTEKIKEKFKIDAVCRGENIVIEHPLGAEFVPRLAGSFPGEILSITLRKPGLGDVFMHLTGHSFWEQESVL